MEDEFPKWDVSSYSSGTKYLGLEELSSLDFTEDILQEMN